MSEPETISAGGLQNIGPDNKVPKSRLATAQAARGMLSQLIDADIPASIDRTRIQRNIDNYPPFTQTELEKAGQGWRSNFNSGGARAKIRDYLTAFHDIITSTSTLPCVKITIGDKGQRADWGQKFSQRYHEVLFGSYEEWNFLKEMELHHKQLAIHGVGPVFRREAKDWRFYALKRRNILVPRDSPADLTRIPIIFIRDTMYVNELYKYIRNPSDIKKAKENTKWNRDAAMTAIKGAQISTPDKFNVEDAEEQWQDNEYDWGLTKSKQVKIAHAFVREFDGISHHIFTETTPVGQSVTDNDGTDGYLYSDVGGLDSMLEAVWVCFQDVGNGDFESVRGLGLEAHQWGEAQNRLNNGLFDNALMAGAVMVQADTPEHAEKMTRIEIGPFRVVPPGIEFPQINTGAGVQAQLAVANHFGQQESTNTGSYRTRAAAPSNQERTATEVEAEIGETSKLSNASVSHYLVQLDQLIDQTWKALTRPDMVESDAGAEIAVEFRRLLLEEDGIPPELFEELCRTAKVTVTRPIGNGSYADRVSRLSRIGQFMPEMPERKRKTYIRDSIALIGGDRALADAYGPDVEGDAPGIEYSLAVLENNGFIAGGTQDPFNPDNAHEIHLPIHLQAAAQILQGDPEKAVQIMQALQPHMEEHLEALAQDPTRKQDYASYNRTVAEVKRVTDKLTRQVEMAAQSQQPEMSPEMMQMQADNARKDQATQADIQRKNAKTESDMKRKDVTTAQQLSINQAKAQQDLESQRIKTLTDVQQQQIKTAAVTDTPTK